MPMSNRIKTAREGLGYTQAELGEAVGVSQTCVWNWESDNTHPRAKSLTKLARVLEVSIDHLENGTSNTPVQLKTVEAVLEDAKSKLADILKLPAEKLALQLSIQS